MNYHTKYNLFDSIMTSSGHFNIILPLFVMANTRIRKRLLEEKVGLNREDLRRSGFEQEIVDIVWDVVNHRYRNIFEHPLVTQDEDNWPDWVLFVVSFQANPSIWTVKEEHLRTVSMIQQNTLTPCDLNTCFTEDAVIHRFAVIHRVIGESDQYHVETDELKFRGNQPQFDQCLYIGTLHLSLRGIKAIVVERAKENDLALQSDGLDFCKDFVRAYCDITETRLTVMQEKAFEGLATSTETTSPSNWQEQLVFLGLFFGLGTVVFFFGKN